MLRLPEHSRDRHPEDIALWPDGGWATMREVRRGEFTWKSDDYEIIQHADTRRLQEAGILDDIV